MPLVRPVFQSWQNCPERSRGTKPESLFHALY